jgi:hypothetical protein
MKGNFVLLGGASAVVGCAIIVLMRRSLLEMMHVAILNCVPVDGLLVYSREVDLSGIPLVLVAVTSALLCLEALKL